MPSSGLFITLYDEDTLKLYLSRGIYGFLMKPVHGEVSSKSRHYNALADYACARDGTHVFFFLRRRIIYGGQIIGSEDFASFYINGPYSPLGRQVNASIFWDESVRSKYESTEKEGIFTITGTVGEKCQPYLILFTDRIGLKGKVIKSDQLYWELGKYPYPLPSNTISEMGFCTMTPGEVDIAIRLLKNDAVDSVACETSENIHLIDGLIAFQKDFGVTNLHSALHQSEFINEAHMEAFILANPSILPERLRPASNTTICRQVPMSPFKPYQLDRVNICYYSQPSIRDGTIPNKVIELKIGRLGKGDVDQVVRYLNWLYLVLEDKAADIPFYLCGKSKVHGICNRIPETFREQVNISTFS